MWPFKKKHQRRPHADISCGKCDGSTFTYHSPTSYTCMGCGAISIKDPDGSLTLLVDVA